MASLASGLREAAHVSVSELPADRVAYSRDFWPRHLIDVRRGRPAEHQPGAIAWVETEQQVVEAIRFARAEGAHIVPFGAGSGVCGAVLPDERSIVLDTKRMAGWRLVEGESAIDVAPGAMGITLEEDLQREGLTIGHFPSSILCSTVGGWIAARGAGQCSGLYGKIEDMVVSLDVVLGTGERVRLHRHRAAPDLPGLFVGSEGTMGVITSARLRVHPVPTSRSFGAFQFRDMRSGWDAIREMFQSGLRPAVTRLYDPIDSYMMRSSRSKARATPGATAAAPRRRGSARRVAAWARRALGAPRLLNAALGALDPFLGGCTLVVVFDGQDGFGAEDMARARDLAGRAGGRWIGEEPARHWLARRYSVSYRLAPVFRMGAFTDTMEVAAPWSRLGEVYRAVHAALGRHVLVMAHLSHAYPDGCSIYFTFVGSAADDAAALSLYDRAWADALAACVSAGATISHHHGVGRSKAAGVERELGFGAEVVRRILRACDPDGVLNPGCLVPRAMRAVRGPRPTREARAASVDVDSLSATVPAGTTLGAVEELLRRHGMTLRLSDADPDLSVARWLAGGAPGARDRFSDPVDQVVTGLTACLSSDEQLEVRPQPRRAVGPDLTALFVGAADRVGEITEATVRGHRLGSPASRDLPYAGRAPGEPTADERRLFDDIVASVTSQRDS